MSVEEQAVRPADRRFSRLPVMAGAVAVVVLVLHFGLLFVNIARPAPLSSAVDVAGEYTRGPFEADWRLFAPYPPRGEYLYEVRGSVMTSSGSGWTTPWYALGYRPSTERWFEPQPRRLGQVVSVVGEEYASAERDLLAAQDRPGGEPSTAAADAQREMDLALGRLSALGSGVLAGRGERDVVAVQVRETSVTYPEFTDRRDTQPTVASRDLPWTQLP